MALDLITGHQGVAHISARQISDINKAVMNGYGDDAVVRMTGAELTQDGLTIEISTGYWRSNGFDVEVSEEETVYIDPSSVGTSRIDNVYVELLQDIPTGAQRAEIVTVQGDEAVSPTAPEDPTAPVLNTDILLEVVLLAQVTVTEGAMELDDMTVTYDLVTPAELEAVEDKADDAQKMIAPIEEGPDASRAYSKDAQFVYNGLLHVAKSAIAQNDTLVEDGNMELAPDVVSQLATLNSNLNEVGTVVTGTKILNVTVSPGTTNTVAYKALPSAGTWLCLGFLRMDYFDNHNGLLFIDNYCVGAVPQGISNRYSLMGFTVKTFGSGATVYLQYANEGTNTLTPVDAYITCIRLH